MPALQNIQSLTNGTPPAIHRGRSQGNQSFQITAISQKAREKYESKRGESIVITFDITESPGTEITIRQRNIEARASQELAPGCSRKRSQIEDELDDEDDSFGILTDVVENSWIDDPENYDLVDVFERNQRGRRSRDDFDDWFDP